MRDAVVRRYRRGDARGFVGLVRALARYEKLRPPTAAAARRLVADVGRRIEVLVCASGGRLVGYAIYLFTYSSFLARPTLFLEDIFVLPEHRRQGLGGRMFGVLTRIARKRRCGRMEWIVLDWNRPAHRFYGKRRARPLAGWTIYRTTL